MTETDDLMEEATYIQRIFLNATKMRKALQKRAITKMANGEDVKIMLEIIQMTKREDEDE